MGEEIRVQEYEDWMKSQIVALFASEYGRDEALEDEAFTRFYEHPFQRNNAVMLAALDGERVAGFQSYFFWPYRKGDEQFRSYQSGRSLVSSQYRGRGVFARLLGHLDDHPDGRIDFLMGFPVEMSFGSFLRNRWTNPLDLFWYARVLHPLSAVRGLEATSEDLLDPQPEAFEVDHPPGIFSLSKATDFTDWRAACSVGRTYRYFHYGDGEKRVRFNLKLNRRGRINELVIGDVAASHADRALIDGALRELLRALRPHRQITILSIALNAGLQNDPLRPLLLRRGFVRLRPKIHFIVKDIRSCAGINDASRWRLLRADIDTW